MMPKQPKFLGCLALFEVGLLENSNTIQSIKTEACCWFFIAELVYLSCKYSVKCSTYALSLISWIERVNPDIVLCVIVSLGSNDTVSIQAEKCS